MHWVTALFLTTLGLVSLPVFAQESIQDWSKKVIELQEKEGQNFEQDLQLVKGFLYLQRRVEALTLLNRLMKSQRRDSRLSALYETASNQFFFQDTAELYADSVQLIREERFAEAKEKLDIALQKESHHRLLILREIQVGIVLGQSDSIVEPIKVAESLYADLTVWKVYNAWINLTKSDGKDAYRMMSGLWVTDRKLFETSEVATLAFLQAIDLKANHSPSDSNEVIALLKIVQKHPEWVGARTWKPVKDAKEIASLKIQFQDLGKLNAAREKLEKETSYFYVGFISLEKSKTAFEGGLKGENKKP